MNFGITVEREISHAKVIFTAMLETAAQALETATLLATGTAPSPAKAQAEKKPETAATTAKPSTEPQTPAASNSSASSSTASKNASEQGAKDDTPAELNYDTDVKPLVLAIAKESREKAEALLQRFGVQSAKALKPDQFADFKAKAEQVIAGTYDPIASDEKALA
ncbi:hypothetical protein [Achromobacter xylosoxidans]|uniref:hypothetical protein n=1 Tax=Alcaligenes xylosoxydans xylosoxydans TaxID=85698 RepID=UPI001EEB6DC6|nr:hypothetical protein [Achromobacter xylosoxidans]